MDANTLSNGEEMTITLQKMTHRIMLNIYFQKAENVNFK